MSLIEVRELSFRYPGRIDETLNKVSLSLDRGKFVSLLGPNGSGKSTLALILAGLKEESGGSISLSREERRTLCRIVFQNPDNQIIGETVEEDVAFGPENLNLPTCEIRERVDEALQAVSLYEKRYDSPNSLSGGEKQRLAVASALALKPQVLILDEATSMLDRKSSLSLVDLLGRECREHGLSVLFITHHTHEALNSDNIYIINNGNIVISGKPQDVLKYDILDANSLPIPYSIEVSHALGLGDALTLTELKDKILRRVRND